MAGARAKYRHLSRSSAHRQALLRNLVTSLFKHESIATTWQKAKEAQPLAEQLVTLAKKNTEATRRRARQIFFEPNEMVPKLFEQIRKRYAERPGGYTRVLRIEPLKEDQAESAILELVDGPRDLRFAMTAKALARLPDNAAFDQRTAEGVKKAIQFRKDGTERLQEMVQRMREEMERGLDKRKLAAPRKVYPEEKAKREMHYYEDTKNGKPANRVPWRLKRLAWQERLTWQAAPNSGATRVLSRTAAKRMERKDVSPSAGEGMAKETVSPTAQ